MLDVDVVSQLMHFQWEGPLAEAGMPDDILYAPHLRFLHDAAEPKAALSGALEPLLGRPRRRLLGLSWEKAPYALRGTARPGEVRLQNANRLKPKPLARLVEALESMEGARDLEIKADVRHFSPALSNLRACTPCQARRF